MSRRRSLRGKEIADAEAEDVQARLPKRLFATDRYPCKRNNMYSTIDNLLCVRDALNGTKEMGILLRSCFGSLFRLPVRRLLMGKVIHGMLTRFSLVEFGEVTGLPCGEFEEGYSIDYELQPTEENYAY
ncbi:BnaCnng61730D [Brassica napus]|uniref:BnaCnng61730D protein n=3 Tax=Brassica TaxID=3705 RepID=A0A078JRL3_BRANA|nr:BnaCnng61730D [Brassica napus]